MRVFGWTLAKLVKNRCFWYLFNEKFQKPRFLINLANVHQKIMNKKVEIWIFWPSRIVNDSKKPPELGFMVQDQFSRPLFSYGSAFWVYRGSVSVEQRHCLCGTETVSVWNRHSVCVGHTQCLCVGHTQSRVAGGRGSRATPTPHWGFPVPTHTHPKLLSRSCGGTTMKCWSKLDRSL